MELVESKKERSKYAQGRLHLVTFGELGEKQDTYAPESDNYLALVDRGRRMVDDGDITSFSVARVLYNSLTPGRFSQ